ERSSWLDTPGRFKRLYQLPQNSPGYEQRVALRVYAIVRDATVINALVRRIQREDTELYPMVDKLS
ncbi:MAG: hypothetical protein WBP25_10475, partial [Giesbergeria sp.]